MKYSREAIPISSIPFPFNGLRMEAYKIHGIEEQSFCDVVTKHTAIWVRCILTCPLSVKAKLNITTNKIRKENTPMKNFIRTNTRDNAIIKPLYGLRRVAVDFEDSIIDAEIKKLKAHFGFEMYISNDSEIEILTEWIRKHDPKFKYHLANPYGLNTKKNKSFILDGIFIVKLAPCTYLYVDAKSNGLRWGRNRTDEESYRYNPIYLYLFGRKSIAFFNKLSKFIDVNNTSSNKIYSIVGVKDGNRSFWNCTASRLTPRTMNTIFIDPEQKKRIIDHIDQWVKNEDMYTNRNLLFKTGILLYGNPGTGKSSMAMAIANHLGCGLITIDPTTFQYMNIPEITESIVADETRYVILIDEIDTIFKSREDENASDDQVKNTSKLMQFLDSQQSPTNVLFIATTNYIERLDKALLRKGRFDIVEKMGDISYDIAMTMCKSFGLAEYESLSIIEEMNPNGTTDNKNALYNPASLQAAILSYLKQKEQIVTDVVIDDESNDEESEKNETQDNSNKITDIGYNSSKSETSLEEEVNRLKELYAN